MTEDPRNRDSPDAFACLTIAPMSLAIAAVLVWVLVALVPNVAYSWAVGIFVAFWAVGFGVIALLALRVILREFVFRPKA